MSRPRSSVAVAIRSAARPTHRRAADRFPQRVSLAELLMLGASVAVGVVALVSLVAADLGHHSLGLVLAVSAVLLVLLAGVVARVERPVLRLDLHSLVPAALAMTFASVMFFPGFEYGTGDRDPGAYVEHAVAISRTHGLRFHDDLVAAGLPGGLSSGVQWPALWSVHSQPSTILPQFYHLWTGLLATAYSAGGYTGLFNTTPLIAVLSVGTVVMVARRVGGPAAALTAAVILPSSMLEVWQAKYPSSEIFAQMLFTGTLLGVVLTVRTGWRSAAAAAGFLLSLCYLERPDGIVLVVLAWAALCLLIALRRYDVRCAWFTGGLLVPFPYGLYQAYHEEHYYTIANAVPEMLPLLIGMLALLAIALGVRSVPKSTQGLLRRGARPRARVVLGTLFFLVCGAAMLLGGLRPRLFGEDLAVQNGVLQRTYDEMSLIRLSWFFSTPGLVLLLLGLGYVGWRRWAFDRWVIGLSTAGLMALYCYHVRNSAYLMWSTRRFVPTVVPGIVVLMGCGATLLVVVLARRLPLRLVVAAVAAFVVGLTVFNLSESWPLRAHDEQAGSIGVEKQIAALSPDGSGVFIWQPGYGNVAPYILFGGPLLAINGRSSALLPMDAPGQARVITTYVDYAASSSRPLFYVSNTTAAPPDLPGMTSQKVLDLSGILPHWAETFEHRPKGRTDYVYQFSVYRLTPG